MLASRSGGSKCATFIIHTRLISCKGEVELLAVRKIIYLGYQVRYQCTPATEIDVMITFL